MEQAADVNGAALGHRASTLRALIKDLRSAVIAYSGGVDSSLVAAIAYEQLGDRALAITGVSASLAAGELDAARQLAARMGIRHETIETREFDDPAYRANGADRCFHCKDELFARLTQIARARGFEHVADGTNADDGRSALDVRPGQRAARERAVRSPLAQAGMGKDAVRALARELALPVWDKPAAPCLSSRVPHGTRIELDDLRRIDLAECYLRASGFPIVRVRHFGVRARIEVPIADVERLRAREEQLARTLREVGYTAVEIDARGYRTGSLNEATA